MKSTHINNLLLLLIFAIASNDQAYAFTNGAAANTIFQTFAEGGYSEMTLEMDFDQLLENIKSEEEHTAQLSLLSDHSETMEMQVKIKPRGVFRRYSCDIPPLRFNFSKKDLEALGLKAEFDKLKLVAPCFENAESEQHLLKEYWAYKLYNEITPASFQVHLVKITYVNTGAVAYQKEQWAFFIESKDELANRLGGSVVEQFGTTPADLDQDSYQQTMMFNFMIGNHDWELAASRNVTFVQLPESPFLVLVPYDFDYSAFVSPSYLAASKSFYQQDIDDRVLVGQFESWEALSKTAEIFHQSKDLLLTSFDDLDLLKKKHKNMMTWYLDGFFSILENEKKLARQFM